tara:strand:- start:262 stop:1665 length:1404 start_codon:yes stop_codon:yes gene_type:complete
MNHSANKTFSKSVRFIIFFFAPVLVGAALTGESLYGQTSLFTNAFIITGDGEVIERGAMLVEGDAILDVGPVRSVSVPENTAIIDLEGKTIVPAFIDAHAHLGYQGRTGWGSINYNSENLIDNLQQYAYYGFGTVFSAGSDVADLVWKTQESWNRNDYIGARILAAAGMAPPGQGPNNQFLEHILALEKSTGTKILWGLENSSSAKAAVKQAASQGFQFIKLWVDDRGGSQQKLRPTLYRAVIEEANSLGLKVFVHQQRGEDMPDLIAAGAHGFLHGRLGRPVGPVIAMQLNRSDVFVVPNLGLGELRREAIGIDPFLADILSSELLNQLSPTSNQRSLQVTRNTSVEEELLASFNALLEANVDIVLGTDAGAIPGHPFGYTGHRELEIYVRLGMTTMEALMAGTSKAAFHLQLDDTGLLQPGFRADFVVLEKNPLEDIRNTRTILEVYLGGLSLDRESLRDKWQDP